MAAAKKYCKRMQFIRTYHELKRLHLPLLLQSSHRKVVLNVQNVHGHVCPATLQVLAEQSQKFLLVLARVREIVKGLHQAPVACKLVYFQMPCSRIVRGEKITAARKTGRRDIHAGANFINADCYIRSVLGAVSSWTMRGFHKSYGEIVVLKNVFHWECLQCLKSLWTQGKRRNEIYQARHLPMSEPGLTAACRPIAQMTIQNTRSFLYLPLSTTSK